MCAASTCQHDPVDIDMNLGFKPRCILRLSSAGMCQLAVWYGDTNVSEEYVIYLRHEDGSNRVLRNDGSYPCEYTASHPGRQTPFVMQFF